MFRPAGWDSLREWIDDLLPEGSLRARFVKGAFWSTVGVAISQLLTFAASVLVVRMFGRQIYGEFSMVRSTVMMLSVFAYLSLGMTATKYVAEFRKTEPARTGRIIGLSSAVAGVSGFVAAAAMFILAPFLADNVMKAPLLVPELRIASLVLWLEAVNGAQMGALAGLEAFRSIALANFYRGLLNFPFMTIGAYEWGLPGAVVAMVCVAACGWVINVIILRRELRRHDLRVEWRETTKELPLLWGFALPASLSGFLMGPVVWIANALLVRQPDGYSAFGMFNAANIMRTLVLTVGAPLGMVLLPMLSSKEGQKSERFQRANVLVSWVLGLTVAVPVICFPEVVGEVFGRDFAGSEFNHTLVLVVFCAAILCYKQGLARIVAARNLMWWGFLSNSVTAALFLCAMLVGRFHGSLGMAASFAVAYALNTLVFVPFYVRRGLVARELIWSWEAFSVWVGLTAAVALDFAEPSVYVRAVAAVVLSALVYVMVRRMLRTVRAPAATPEEGDAQDDSGCY